MPQAIKKIFLSSIVLRLFLLIITPYSLFIDGINRYIPDSDKILKLNFNFWTPPGYSGLLTVVNSFLNPPALAFVIQLLNLLIWILLFLQIFKFLQNLDMEISKIQISLLLFSFLAWPILLSITILPDILFTYIFFLILNLLIDKRNWRFEKYLKLVLLILFFLMIKPMAFIILPAILAFWVYRNYKVIDFPKTLFRILLSFFIGFVLFTPWMYKNKVQTGHFFETVQSEESKNSLNFIEKERLLGQIEKSFTYFWEIPNKDQINSEISLGKIKINKKILYIYYLINLVFFVTFSIIMFFNFIKSTFLDKNKASIAFAILISTCTFFSLIYWPFFSKYNYWDTGRYTFPILIFYLYFFSLKPRSLFSLVLPIIIITLSLLNTSALILRYRILINNIENVSEILAKRSLNSNKIYTNDSFTKEILEYENNVTIEFVEDIARNNCSEMEEFKDFIICKNEKENYTAVIKTNNLSRITR